MRTGNTNRGTPVDGQVTEEAIVQLLTDQMQASKILPFLKVVNNTDTVDFC